MKKIEEKKDSSENWKDVVHWFVVMLILIGLTWGILKIPKIMPHGLSIPLLFLFWIVFIAGSFLWHQDKKHEKEMEEKAKDIHNEDY